MFCSKCGKEIQAGIKFCPGCGNPVEITSNPDNGQAETNQPTAQSEGADASAASSPMRAQAQPSTSPQGTNTKSYPNANAASIVYEKYKGYWSTGRLTIGIISILLFVFITFQSCAVGVGNALMESEATSGSQGAITAFCYLIAGIVGIATRNIPSKTGAFVAGGFYWVGALFTIGTGDTYGDLPLWGTLSVIFGLVFIISAIKTRGGKKG